MHLPAVTSVAVSDSASWVLTSAGCTSTFPCSSSFSFLTTLQPISGAELSPFWLFSSSSLMFLSEMFVERGAEASSNCFVENDSLDCRLNEFL